MPDPIPFDPRMVADGSPLGRPVPATDPATDPAAPGPAAGNAAGRHPLAGLRTYEPPPAGEAYRGQDYQVPGPPPAPPAGSAGLGDELNTLDPKARLHTLENGMLVRIKPLRTRALLALVGIGLAGIGNQLTGLQLDPDGDPDVFMARFLGLVLSALPHAQDEVCEFLLTVVEPTSKKTGTKIDKEQRAANKALDAELSEYMDDPHPDDTISILEFVIADNAGDLQTWGKRLAGVFKLAMRTGQIPASRQSPAPNASAA